MQENKEDLKQAALAKLEQKYLSTLLLYAPYSPFKAAKSETSERLYTSADVAANLPPYLRVPLVAKGIRFTGFITNLWHKKENKQTAKDITSFSPDILQTSIVLQKVVELVIKDHPEINTADALLETCEKEIETAHKLVQKEDEGVSLPGKGDTIFDRIEIAIPTSPEQNAAQCFLSSLFIFSDGYLAYHNNTLGAKALFLPNFFVEELPYVNVLKPASETTHERKNLSERKRHARETLDNLNIYCMEDIVGASERILKHGTTNPKKATQKAQKTIGMESVLFDEDEPFRKIKGAAQAYLFPRFLGLGDVLEKAPTKAADSGKMGAALVGMGVPVVGDIAANKVQSSQEEQLRNKHTTLFDFLGIKTTKDILAFSEELADAVKKKCPELSFSSEKDHRKIVKNALKNALKDAPIEKLSKDNFITAVVAEIITEAGKEQKKSKLADLPKAREEQTPPQKTVVEEKVTESPPKGRKWGGGLNNPEVQKAIEEAKKAVQGASVESQGTDRNSNFTQKKFQEGQKQENQH